MYIMSQSVVPVLNIVTSQTYTRFNVTVQSLILNVSARFNVQIYDSSMNIVNSITLAMEGSDYAGWQGDDNYVYQWVNSQLHILFK